MRSTTDSPSQVDPDELARRITVSFSRFDFERSGNRDILDFLLKARAGRQLGEKQFRTIVTFVIAEQARRDILRAFERVLGA